MRFCLQQAIVLSSFLCLGQGVMSYDLEDYAMTYSIGKLCPKLLCTKNCEWGFKTDGDGCLLCECRLHPCALMLCGPGKTCVIEGKTCTTPPCRPPGGVCKVIKPTCPPQICAMFCQYGNVVDENGCSICKCRPGPCESHKCAPGQRCEAQNIVCITQPCNPIPVCKPIDICKLRSETGFCFAAFRRYFFNSKTGKCDIFIYGGCGGNENNFETLSDCQKNCGGPEPNPCEFGAPLPGVFCGRGPTRQDCPATHSCVIDPADRFAVCCREGPVCPLIRCYQRCIFDRVKTKDGCATCKCKRNPCRTKQCSKGEQCHLQKGTCDGTLCYPSASCEPVDPCNLTKKKGRCYARIQRYYYNYKSKRCEIFSYGGCGGNENNFKTLEECEKKCGCDNRKCSTDSCKATRCSAFPTATCKTNVCGGCKAEFFLGGRKVNCNLETCLVGQMCIAIPCPALDFKCGSHDHCPSGTKCCRGCCGSGCKPDTNDGFCPQPLSFEFNCKNADSSIHCVGDHQCSKDQKCCVRQDGCKYCDKSVEVPRKG